MSKSQKVFGELQFCLYAKKQAKPTFVTGAKAMLYKIKTLQSVFGRDRTCIDSMSILRSFFQM